MKAFSREIKLGIVSILAIAIIYFGIIFLKNIRLASTHNLYYVSMPDVNGLAPQSNVLANGMNVGTVKNLSFDPQTQMVNVAIELSEGFTLPIGSTATLQKDLLGAPMVRIILGRNPSQVLSQGDTIQGFAMTDLMTSASDLMPSIKMLLPKLDSILTSLQLIAANPAIAQSLSNLQEVTGNLCTTTAELNLLLKGSAPQLLAHLDASAVNLQTMTSQMNEIDLKGMAQQADSTLSQLSLFTSNLNNPNSSLGRLTQDNGLYLHLDSTVQSANLLLNDLRLHPKRYVHFSVFGKKDN